MPTWLKWFTEAKKTGVVVLSILVSALALGLIPDPWNKYAVIVIQIATAAGVFSVKNKPPVE